MKHLTLITLSLLLFVACKKKQTTDEVAATPNETVVEQTSESNNNDLQKGDPLTYSVQLGTYSREIDSHTIFDKVPQEIFSYIYPDGYIRYYSGQFETVDQSITYRNELRNLGYEDAFSLGLLEDSRHLFDPENDPNLQY